MKMLLFGGTGRTGQVMHRVARATGWQVVAPAHAECDLLQSEYVSDCVLGSGADLVVNCAAISGLEACLDDPLSAHLVNAVAPAAMALACRHTGARFVHLSTDYVLEGHRSGLKEERSRCKPINVYGESKKEGELQVLEALPQALILRVSWVCGNPHLPSFVETTLRKAFAGEELAAIADKFSLPTDAEDIARVVLALADRRVSGVLHVCSVGEPMSWYDCACTALEHAARLGAVSTVPRVERQLLAHASFFREPRPRHTSMSTVRLRGLGVDMPSAQQTLCRVTERYLLHAGRNNYGSFPICQQI